MSKKKAIPAKEAWLYKNKKALKSVMEGLEQARKGQLVDGPKLSEKDRLIDLLEEAADSVLASTFEDGISDFRREYRIDLERRLRLTISHLK